MASFCFVHAADLHLDTPFVGLDASHAELAARLRDASLAALDRIVAKAIAVEAAFVIFAGDLYDGAERGLRAQLRFRDAVGRLAAAGIAVVVVHGNHDPEGGHWSAVQTWPEGVHVCGSDAVTSVPIVRDGARIATVHGISYRTRHVTDNLALRFPRVSKGFHVAALHCNVGDQPGHAAYSPCRLADLTEQGMAYWALGHVHRHAILCDAPWVVYPGNTQGRSFAPGERGKKGAVVVDVVDDAIATCAFFETDTARFIDLLLSIDGETDLGRLADRLTDEATRVRAEHPGVDLLVRATLAGRTSLFRILANETEREALRQSLDDLSENRLFWLALASECQPAIDRETIAAGSDLRAEVLATADGWAETLPPALLAELKVAGMTPTAAELAGLVEGAALGVIDQLTPEER